MAKTLRTPDHDYEPFKRARGTEDSEKAAYGSYSRSKNITLSQT